MRIHFGSMGESYRCTYEITYGNHKQREIFEAPRFMLEQRFLQYVQEASAEQAPVKIKMSREEQIWSQYDGKMLSREYSITFRNNSYENTFGLEEDGAT